MAIILRQIYEKYKIPVVWLTPSDFADLHENLILKIASKDIMKKASTFKLEYWTNPLNYKRIKALKEEKPDIYNKYAKELKREFPRTK